MTTKHDNERYDEAVGQGALPSVISKARLILPEDYSLRESIRKAIEPEERTSCIGFWGKFTPTEPKKRGRPFTKKRGGKRYDDGEKKEKY
jgi:hypothetical protein